MTEDNTQAPEVKAPKFCSKSFTEDGVVSFTFGNGTTITIDTNELTDEQRFNLMMHGTAQKGGDSYASCQGDYPAAIAALQKVSDQLLANQWNASRASAGEAAPKIGELSQAIANLKGMDLVTVNTAVAKATDEERKAWRKNSAIAAEIARMRAEKAAARAAKETAGGTADDIVI